jgi:hypothetical protein
MIAAVVLTPSDFAVFIMAAVVVVTLLIVGLVEAARALWRRLKGRR